MDHLILLNDHSVLQLPWLPAACLFLFKFSDLDFFLIFDFLTSGVHTCLLAFHWYIWKDILVFWDFWFIVEQVHAYGIVIWSMGQFLLPAGGAGSILSGYVLVVQSIS